MIETTHKKERIPVVIVTGFLGAGKTTFLRELLPLLEGGPRQPYVILNDFLNAEIDSASLKAVTAEVHAISAGCVCCESSDDLNRVLHAIPDQPPLIVFIEANGTTDPYPLLELITLLPRHHQRFGPILQLNVVNEKRWQERLMPWDRALERAQAATASHIFTNRGSSASLRQQLKVQTELGEINRHAARVRSPQEFEGLIRSIAEGSTIQPEIDLSAPLGHAHHHIATRIELPPMEGAVLIRWLQSFPPEVLRIKGAVRLIGDEHEACLFQRTDDELERPSLIKGTMPSSTEPCAVFIGVRLDPVAIERSLRTILAAFEEDAVATYATPRLPALTKMHQSRESQ